MTEPVWIARVGAKFYHTDRDCIHLDQSRVGREPLERDLEDVSHCSECRRCSGELDVRRTGGSKSHYRSLLEEAREAPT